MDAEWVSLVTSIQDRANQINAEMQRQFLRVETPGDQFTIDADMFGGREWTFLLHQNGAIVIHANNRGNVSPELFAWIVKDGEGFAFDYDDKKIDAKDFAAAILSEFLDPKSVWGH